MKKKIYFSLISISWIVTFSAFHTTAKFSTKSSKSELSNPIDTNISKFLNCLKASLNDSTFKSKSFVSTFTIFKIFVNRNGGIANIKFSDSADTLFTKEFIKEKIFDKCSDSFQKYIAIHGYKNIAFLIPINYDPFQTQKRLVFYNQMESLITFDHQEFFGNAIVLETVITNSNL